LYKAYPPLGTTYLYNLVLRDDEMQLPAELLFTNTVTLIIIGFVGPGKTAIRADTIIYLSAYAPIHGTEGTRAMPDASMQTLGRGERG